MRMIRLKLKNFASIWTGMNKTEIDIDFTRCKNRIILITGENGTGKTSLLSQMNPFPNLIATDIRATENLILEGKDGYKLFILEHNGDVYVCEHYYRASKDKHITACSFKKNGKELNPNGTVRGFYEVISVELGLDPSFLKIIRLGPNMTDIIAMKASERKEFISTFLSEVGIFTTLFKTAKEESNYVKTQLKIITSQYDDIADFEDLKSVINTNNLLMEQLNEKKTELERKQYGIEAEIKEKVIPDDTLIKYEDDYRNNLTLFKMIDSISIPIATLRKNWDGINIEYQKKLSESEHLNSDQKRIAGELVRYDDKITDLTNKLALISARDSVENIDEVINKTESQLIELENEVKFDVKKDKATYLQIYKFWQDIRKLIDVFFEEDRTVIQLIKDNASGKKLENIVESVLKAMDKKLNKLSEKIGVAKTLGNAEDTSAMVLFIPERCRIFHECPYYLNLSADLNGNKKKKSVKDLEEEFDLYDRAKAQMNIISMILKIYDMMSALTDEVMVLPCSKEEIMLFVLNHKVDEYNGYEEIVHDFINQAEIKERIAECNDIITKLKLERATLASSGNYEFIQASLDEAKRDRDAKDEELKAIKKNIAQLSSELMNILSEKESLSGYIKYLDEYDSNRMYYDSIKKNHEAALHSNEVKYELMNRLSDVTQKIKDLMFEINRLKKETKENEYKFIRKDELKKQKETLEERFEWVELVKESLSSTKGIPLIFIQLYLKNIQIMANDIIHEMFDKDISLLNFNITEKEFTIPYVTNGIEVKDVSYASQGERTTIVIALSFAILQQFLSKYNILLLDEMDGPLYKENKKKFVGIVEKEMDRISCEQAVLITHNDLFENYPVDLIITSPIEVGFNKANIIWEV